MDFFVTFVLVWLLNLQQSYYIQKWRNVLHYDKFNFNYLINNIASMANC